MATNPVVKHTVGAQPQDSKSTPLRLIEQRQARQESSHQPQEVLAIRRMTYEYDNLTLKKGGNIGKEQSPM